MIQLLIVGLGNIGKRHLEASLNSKNVSKVYVYDKDKSKLNDMKLIDSKRIIVLDSLNNLNRDINGLILATTSKERFAIFKNLVKKLKLDFAILEKVLFQKISNYIDVVKIVKSDNLRVYVNCPARLMTSYVDLKKELENQNIMRFEVKGGNWFMASNSIHFIDLADFLIGSEKLPIIQLKANFKDGNYFNKRPGYVEVFGSIYGHISNVKFNLDCSQNDLPYMIYIETDSHLYTIDETNQYCIKFSKISNQEVRIKFPIDFVSILTTRAIDNHIKLGQSGLIEIERSSFFHLSLIELILKHLNNIEKRNIKSCPIT